MFFIVIFILFVHLYLHLSKYIVIYYTLWKIKIRLLIRKGHSIFRRRWAAVECLLCVLWRKTHLLQIDVRMIYIYYYHESHFLTDDGETPVCINRYFLPTWYTRSLAMVRYTWSFLLMQLLKQRNLLVVILMLVEQAIAGDNVLVLQHCPEKQSDICYTSGNCNCKYTRH